jgi:hypothetical protein
MAAAVQGKLMYSSAVVFAWLGPRTRYRPSHTSIIHVDIHLK